MSRPAKRHRVAHRRLAAALGGKDRYVGGTGWWIEVEAEIRLLEERLTVPDLAGWRVERVAEMPEDNPLVVVPDWTCEVLSPTTARDDRRLKLPLYIRAGVLHVWLVDPDQRLVEVFEPVGGRATLVASGADDERVAFPPFDDVPVELARLWLATGTGTDG
jgi:Uma2 family endonuclease